MDTSGGAAMEQVETDLPSTGERAFRSRMAAEKKKRQRLEERGSMRPNPNPKTAPAPESIITAEMEMEMTALRMMAQLRGGTVRWATTRQQGWQPMWTCKEGHSFSISKSRLQMGAWCSKCKRQSEEAEASAEAEAMQARMFAAARRRHATNARPAAGKGDEGKGTHCGPMRGWNGTTTRVPSPPPGSGYTREQAQLVQDVLETPAQYVPACMTLPPGSTQQQLRQKFRQVAAKLHPDKNQDPRAADAFKRVSEIASARKHTW